MWIVSYRICNRYIDCIVMYHIIYQIKARISRFLPLTILGILALVGGIVGLLLPETLGAILPETIEDGENFGKDQSFWQFPCCNSKPSRLYSLNYTTFLFLF